MNDRDDVDENDMVPGMQDLPAPGEPQPVTEPPEVPDIEGGANG